MKNKYKVSERNGQPAIFTDRGLVCLMEAGNQSTRERDAAEIVAILNAAPELLKALNSVLEDLCDFQDAYPDLSNQFDGTFFRINEALAKAEGVK
jgi:hypothetical protein